MLGNADKEFDYKDNLNNRETPESKPRKKEYTTGELRTKAIKLIAGTLDISQETDADMKKIEDMRLAILTGTPY